MSNAVEYLAVELQKRYLSLYQRWKLRQAGIYFRGSVTRSEGEFLLTILPVLDDNSLVLYDIGASRGVVSGCCAKIPNFAQIHSFEPLPDVFLQLKKNMSRFPHVTCHNVALGDSNGVVDIRVNRSIDSSSVLPTSPIHDNEFPWTGEVGAERVRLVRLDDYVQEQSLPQPDFVKIDVQGYELRVLHGGEHTLRQARYCFIEMNFLLLYEGGAVFDDVYQAMRRLKYRLIGFSEPVRGRSHRQVFINGLFENEGVA